jgi:hypothetical protein
MIFYFHCIVRTMFIVLISALLYCNIHSKIQLSCAKHNKNNVSFLVYRGRLKLIKCMPQFFICINVKYFFNILVDICNNLF